MPYYPACRICEDMSPSHIHTACQFASLTAVLSFNIAEIVLSSKQTELEVFFLVRVQPAVNLDVHGNRFVSEILEINSVSSKRDLLFI